MSVNGLIVSRVDRGGIADELGIASGDRICAVNGRPVRDILDYRFLTADDTLELLVESSNGAFLYEIEKDYDESLGIGFQSPFPNLKKCRNRCIFCFVDQMPPGLRRSLYIKDDDYRLSFWDGNFITLTNLEEADFARIVEQRLSPLYVSVHTTNPELRRKMMGNPRAGEILRQMGFLARHGIELHTQIVLCPGVNDGRELERTIGDLGALAPSVRSVAVVPVGRTRYREKLFSLSAFTPEQANEVISSVHRWQDRFLTMFDTPLVYAGDEFYIKAGITVPAAERYGGFPQLENGVGLVRLFLDEWKDVRRALCQAPPKVTVVTGEMGASILGTVIEQLNRDTGSKIVLLPVPNRFFGPDVTAAGLLTGADIREALRGLNFGDLVVIPAVALKNGTTFLDDVTLEDLRQDLGVSIVAAGGPRELIEIIEKQ